MGRNDWDLKKTYKVFGNLIGLQHPYNCQCQLLKDVAEEKL
jgi:hypothetical protein